MTITVGEGRNQRTYAGNLGDCTELFESRKLRRDKNGWRAVRVYSVPTTDPEQAAMFAPAHGSLYPANLGSMKLYLKDVQVEPSPVPDECNMVLEYTWEADTDTEESWEWDYTASPMTIYNVRNSSLQENSDGSRMTAIGLQGNSVQGAQVYRLQPRIRVTQRSKHFDYTLISQWESLVNTVNAESFPAATADPKYWPGEVLYLGFRGAKTSNPSDIESVTHEFLVGRNKYGLSYELAGGSEYSFEFISGWNVMWSRLQDASGETETTDTRPWSVHRATVYEYGDFSQLGLRGPAPLIQDGTDGPVTGPGW